MNTTDLKEQAHKLATKWPSQGQPYFFFDSTLGIDSTVWAGTKADHLRGKARNCFKSLDQATTFSAKIAKFLQEHNGE